VKTSSCIGDLAKEIYWIELSSTRLQCKPWINV
jgi:hypothetical protein